jgi:hypothetical protein
MSEKTGKRSWKRWVVGAAGAGIAVMAVAGPAAAAEAQVGVNVSGAVTSAGQVTLYGEYSCDPAVAAYTEIAVTASQVISNGATVTGTSYDRVACTGSTQIWQQTITSPHAYAFFGSGVLNADVTVWTIDDWANRSSTSQSVWVS